MVRLFFQLQGAIDAHDLGRIVTLCELLRMDARRMNRSVVLDLANAIEARCALGDFGRASGLLSDGVAQFMAPRAA